jgi:hypothetical protein
VIGEEVEYAMMKAAEDLKVEFVEFTVAPQVNPTSGIPYHEWFVEFSTPLVEIGVFGAKIDAYLQQKNIYYKDLIEGKILRPLVITVVKPGGFKDYMRSVGKLGGQNKVARLSNDRKIAEELKQWT